MELQTSQSWSKSDINKLIRDWIRMNLELRSEGNTISIGYMRESLAGVNDFQVVSSCQVQVPIHVDNMRFG